MHWHSLKHIDDSPHAIALGVALGIFYGFTPLLGLKTLMAIATAWLLGGNKLAAAIAVTLHDVALPIMPILLRWEYQVGYWLLSNPHEWPAALRLVHQSRPGTWLRWSSFFTIGRPLLLGSFLFSTPTAVLTYFLTLPLIRKVQRKRAARLAAQADVLDL